jgi:hypothetical protein
MDVGMVVGVVGWMLVWLLGWLDGCKLYLLNIVHSLTIRK